MRAFTDVEILDRISKLATFLGFPDGPMDVWIRSRADVYDSFDDKAFTYECYGDTKKPKFVMARNGTTNAGSFYLTKKFENPMGCAVLRSDVIVYNSHKRGLHRGKPAYIQAKGFPYHRDKNRDHKADETGPIYKNIIGANIHRAGTDSAIIYNWSAGCLVTANLQKFLHFLDYLRSQGDPLLTVCILKEW
jgi:hypothetical protein